MSGSNLPCKRGRHGGARSVLCWQEKLSLMDESAIKQFLQQFDCGCKCACGTKIRSLGEFESVKIVRDLRTARMSGAYLPIMHKPRRRGDDGLENVLTAN